MSYVLMELTKVTDRVDALENQSNDHTKETKSVGAVNIEFTGEQTNYFSSNIMSDRVNIIFKGCLIWFNLEIPEMLFNQLQSTQE